MKTETQVKRSKRLRKKLYLDEYKVLGFEVSFQLSEIDENTFDLFFTEIMDFVESRNLIMGGAGGGETFNIFISPYSRYASATEDDRSTFTNWLAERNFIKNVIVGELIDAYYGD
ncbi:50S ribosome-binding protein YggL [Psychromonas sp. MME2]|uniref:YggL 50S ribosome-binding family protein n=1 Tax=unclassified Psychromonas TaxID=2614957 RepID=UPI00339CCD47